MEIFNTFYYKINKVILLVLGLWPYQNKWRTRVCFALHSTLTFSLIIVLVVGLKEEGKGNLIIMLETLVALMFLLAGFTEYIILYKNQSQMKNLYDQMTNDWNTLSDERERNILRIFSREGKTLAIVYCWYIIGAFFLFTVLTYTPSYFNKNVIKGYSQTFPCYARFMIMNESVRQWQIFAHITILFVFNCCFFISVTTTYITSVKHVCGLFAITCYRLKKTFRDDRKKLRKTLRNEQVIMPNLIKTVEKHKDAISGIRLIESTFSSSHLMIDIVCLIVITVGIFYLKYTYDQGDLLNTFRVFTIVFGFTIHIFYINWAGEQILHSCHIMFSTVCLVNWHAASVKARKMLLIIMQRSTKFDTLTTGSVYILSLEHFTNIVKASLSYVAVLFYISSKWNQKGTG